MNSSFSRPAIYVKAKGPGVFQAISFPQGPPSHYNFHQVVQFSGSHPRGAYASSNESVYTTSLGTVPVGAWFALLMRLGFLVGGGKQQWCCRSAVGTCFLSKARVHPWRTACGSPRYQQSAAQQRHSPWNLGHYARVTRARHLFTKAFPQNVFT